MKNGSKSTNNMEGYGIISNNRLTNVKGQFFIHKAPNPLKSLSPFILFTHHSPLPRRFTLLPKPIILFSSLPRIFLASVNHLYFTGLLYKE